MTAIQKHPLSINDPLVSGGRSKQLFKCAPLCQWRQLAVEFELSLIISLTQHVTVVTTEHPAEDAHR